MDKEVFKSKQKLLQFLDIRENFLYGDFNSKYKSREIPKKGGGVRQIRPPAPSIKNVQRKILKSFLINAHINESVYGLGKGKSILDNAKAHSKNKNTHIVCIDIEKFFPSITPKQIKTVFRKLGFCGECVSILTKICTVNGELPQGAPTSPILSALVMDEVDQKIYSYCEPYNIEFTRYFDDVTLSGTKLNEKIVEVIEHKIQQAGFRMNEKKKVWFKPNDTKIVTGVVFLKTGFDVTPIYKKDISWAWKNYSHYPTKKHWRSFMGKMGFYLFINRVLAEEHFLKVTKIDFKKRNLLLPEKYIKPKSINFLLSKISWEMGNFFLKCTTRVFPFS